MSFYVFPLVPKALNVVSREMTKYILCNLEEGEFDVGSDHKMIGVVYEGKYSEVVKRKKRKDRWNMEKAAGWKMTSTLLSLVTVEKISDVPIIPTVF